MGRETAAQPRQGTGLYRFNGIASYIAACVEVQVSPDFKDIKVLRAHAAVDAGMCINPEGLKNQIEGSFTQAASWVLLEEVTFAGKAITSDGWTSYDILRFPAAPIVEVEVIDHPDQPPLGIGEAAQGIGGGAVANAIFNATGRRVRDFPITGEKLAATPAVTGFPRA